jgi:DNA polymerase III subunit gamma/tau
MWALKYRPKSLDEVLGQQYPKQIIRGALKKKRASGFLITGPWGSGKTTITRILAKALACTNPLHTGEACLKCDSCIAIDRDATQNYVEFDAASWGSVADIRRIIQDATSAPTGESPFRTIALDESHMLTTQAQNALLKTLEENPEFTVFMLITTDPQRLLPTIASRCIPIALQPVPKTEVCAHLKSICNIEGVSFEDVAIDIIVEETYGHVRDALTLAETISLAGHITVENARKHLNLDLEDQVTKILLLSLTNTEELIEQLDKACQDHAAEQVWKACLRIITNAEMLRLAPNRATHTPQAKELADLYATRLAVAAEWILEKGNGLLVRTLSDLAVALYNLKDQLGVTVQERRDDNKKSVQLGVPKNQQRARIKGMEKTFTPDEFAKGLGFYK